MLSKVLSSALLGINAYIVDVEVDISAGLPVFSIIGLPDNAVKESRDRVKAAIKNSGYEFPSRKITVNLAPADVKKEGSLFDLPIAIGVLTAIETIKHEKVKDSIFLGELSFDGRIKPVRGVLPMVIKARDIALKRIILPKKNSDEAALVKDIEVLGVDTFSELVEYLKGNKDLAIIASIAIPVFYGYKYKASMAEAQSNIGAINSLEMAYATDNISYVTAAWTPASIPGLSKVPWQTGNYLDNIGFSIKGNVRFRYSVGTGGTWVAAPSNNSAIAETSNVDIIIQAEGDIDGNGATSQFYTTDETMTITRVNNNY